MTLGTPTNATLGTTAGSDDHDHGQRRGADAERGGDETQDEGDSGTTAFVFTLTLSAASGQAASVSYATADVTAVVGVGLHGGIGAVTFAVGETTKTVTVSVLWDKRTGG